MFVADDFGLSEDINEAILRAHTEGALQIACLMMGQPGTQGAVAIARDYPSLRVGWHLHLCDSRPTTVETWPWGRSPTAAGLAIAALPGARALAGAEISNQWRMLRATGLPVATVNAHHHLHWHPFVLRSLAAVLAADGEFDGWLRWGEPRFFGPRVPLGYRLVERLLLAPARRRLETPCSDSLWGLDRTFAMNPAEVATVLSGLGGGIHEFVFHPRPGEHDPDTRCLNELRTPVQN